MAKTVGPNIQMNAEEIEKDIHASLEQINYGELQEVYEFLNRVAG